MTDKIFEFILKSVRDEEQRKWADDIEAVPKSVRCFTVDKEAGDLIEPARKCGIHHREREKVYTEKLQEAEKELREKGVSMEVFDPTQGTYLNISQMNVASGNIGNAQQSFQPRIDQRLLDCVKNAKAKMIDHRDKAEQYEKYARAFALQPDKIVRLTIEDVHYFRLEV